MQQNPVFKHSCPIQVRYTDIDLMAHVTNSMYLSYCDIARMQYFNHVLEEQIGNEEESLVIASITIDFICPIFLHEKIEVHTKTTRLGNKSIQMLQHIVNIDTKEVKSAVKSILAGFDYKKQTAIVVSEKWKMKLAAFDTDVEFKHSHNV